MNIIKKIINIFKSKDNIKEQKTLIKKNNVEINNILKEDQNITKKETNIIVNQDKNIETVGKLKMITDNIEKNSIKDVKVIKLIEEINRNVNNGEIKESEIKKIYNDVIKVLESDDIDIKKIQQLETKIVNINKIIKLINKLQLTIKDETITYENYLKSDHYLKMVRVIEILEKIEEYELKTLLENNLGSLYLDFENKVKTGIYEFKKIEKESNELVVNVEKLTEEVIAFTNVLNKATSKTKIELKNDYDKLKRARTSLENKKNEYTKKEEEINNAIINICIDIEENIVMLNKLVEYIVLYLTEENDIIENELNTYTKDKNIESTKKIKYKIQILEKLKNALQIRKEGL